MMQELKDAGIDTIIAEKQAQLGCLGGAAVGRDFAGNKRKIRR